MKTSPDRSRRWRALAAGVLLGVLLLLALAVAAVHTPVARRAVLRLAASILLDRAQIVLRAEGLSYNLLARRATLSDVDAAAARTPDVPFAHADILTIALPWSALFGRLTIDDLALENARVSVVRRADGSTNLPSSTSPAPGEPAALPIGHLRVNELTLEVNDEPSGVFLSLPRIAIDVGPESGIVHAAAPGTIARSPRNTKVSLLDGEVAFDGRSVRIGRLAVRTDEGTLSVKGSLGLLVSEPRVDLGFDAAVDIARAVRWADAINASSSLLRVSGDVVVDGTLSGPFASPHVQARLRSQAVDVERLHATAVRAEIDADAQRLGVARLEARVAGGQVTAAGEWLFPRGGSTQSAPRKGAPYEAESMPRKGTPDEAPPYAAPSAEASSARVDVRWLGIDHAMLQTFAPQLNVRLSGRSTGTASFVGNPADPGMAVIDIQNRMDATPPAQGQLAVAGAFRLRAEGGRWSLQGAPTIANAQVNVDLQGAVNTRRLTASTVDGTLRIPAADLGAVLAVVDRAGLLRSGDIDLRGGAASVDARLAGTLVAPVIDLTSSARDVNVSGVGPLDAEMTARGTLDQLAMRVEARQGSDNVLVATGTVLPRKQRLDLRVDGTVEAPERLAAGAPISGRVDVHLELSGTFSAPRGQGRVDVSRARYDGRELGPIRSTVDLDGATANVTAVLPDFGGELRALVGVAAPHEATIDLRVDRADVGRLMRSSLAALGAQTARVEGVLSLQAHAEGSIDEWPHARATADLSDVDVRLEDLPLTLVSPARVTLENGVARIAGADIHVGEAQLSVAGAVFLGAALLSATPLRAELPGAATQEAAPRRATPLRGAPPAAGAPASIAPAEALQLSLVGTLPQLLGAARAAGLADAGRVTGDGPFALHTRITGSIERPVVTGDLDLGPASVALDDVPPITTLRMRARVDDGWLDLQSLTGTWQGSAITADGRAPLRLFRSYLPESFAASLQSIGRPTTQPASLNARATSVTPLVLAPVVDPDTLPDLQGNVDISARLEADALTLEAVKGELRLDRLDATIAGLPVSQREVTRVVADGGFARVAAWDWFGEGAALSVKGQVGLADRQTAILANGRVDLRMLAPFIRGSGLSTAGQLESSLSITGPAAAPRIDGSILLSSGDLRLNDPRVAVTDLQGRAALSGTGLHVSGLTGAINGGTLVAGADFQAGPGEPMRGQMTAVVRDMALEFPQGLRSAVDSDLTLTLAQLSNAEPGSALGGTLSGTVTVVRGAYREPLALVTGLLASLRNRQTLAAAGTAAGAASRSSNQIALDVRVLTDDDVIVDNNYGRLQMGADLRVIGTAAAPALSGRAELRAGGQLFLGRNIYAIESGTIDFTNPAVVEPDLNILASTRVGTEEIELPIKGTPDRLTIEPHSLTTSDLGTADVWSLLLTGRRLDQVSGDEAQIVGEQVLGYLSGDVLGLAGRAVGLDTIRLGGLDQSTLAPDPTAIATVTDPTARLTFGKSLGSNVNVTFSQSFRDSSAQTWIVDYLPSRHVELRLVSHDDDLRSYELNHDVSFSRRASGNAPSRRPRAPEPKVTAVTFTGDTALPERRLRSVLGLVPGDRFDYAAWQRDRDRLEALYRQAGHLEARVAARRRQVAGGLALSYEIDARAQTRIAVDGHQLSRASLQALADEWSHSVFDRFLEEESALIARRDLTADGYLQARVLTRVTGDADKVLHVDIQPGPRSLQRQVRITSADAAVAADLDAWARAPGLTESAWQDPRSLEREIGDRLHHQGRAHASVRVGLPLFEGTTATLPVAVDPGPVFTVSDISFDGATGLTLEVLAEEVKVAAGSVYDPAEVTAAGDRLSVRYRREGFAGVRITARPSLDASAARVSLAFAIVEGPRQVLEEVSIQGNRGIASDAVVRALGLTIGEPLGAQAWLLARKRVFDTGLFRRVDVSAEPVGQPKPVPTMREDVSSSSRASGAGAGAGPGRAVPGTQPMRVTVTVEEWPALRLRYGFQIAEERPEGRITGRDLSPGFKADVTRRTLFHHAITIGAAGEYQRREQRVRTFLSAPTLFGRAVRSSFSLERSHEEFLNVTLITNVSRASWEQRVTVAEHVQLSYSYSFERDHTFDTAPSRDVFVPAFDVAIDIARLNSAVAYDTRNDPTNTQRGMLLSSSLEYAPSALGSDIRFVRTVGQAYYFRPWRRTVLASAARIGIAQALGDQELIRSELFFAGGARTVRGLAENTLGPRDFFGDPAGGGGLLVVNQEVRFPIYRWVGGVGFVDAGNVFVAASDISLRSLVGSSGAGLRMTTPFGILRLDYGRRWSGGPGGWYVGIGQSF